MLSIIRIVGVFVRCLCVCFLVSTCLVVSRSGLFVFSLFQSVLSCLTHFYIASQADFHEYSLRRLLSSYISNLDIDTDLHVEMMHDDAKFAVAVQLYPHVVTHFFASKSEIWLSVFMMELYGLKDASAAYEFSGGRGAIHTHLLALMENHAVDEWNDALKNLAGESVSSFLYFLRFIFINHVVFPMLFDCWTPPFTSLLFI